LYRALPFVALALAACAGQARDVVPETHDTRVSPAPSAASSEGYVYVARRSHGLVALAESRGIAEDAARQLVDHLADELDACAARLAREGKLADGGAGRVVATLDADGSVRGVNVKAAPGPGVAANFLMCVVSPLRLASFPAADAGARGLAIEATWGAGADGGP
jgi:hypothetical protein